MKTGIIVNLKHFKVLNYITKNKIFLLLAVMFVAGLTFGSIFTVKNFWLSKNTETFFNDFILLHTKKTFLKKLFFCTARNLAILVVYFLSGASMMGMAVTPFIMVWQGIFIGGIISRVYTLYGINGIAFNTIILIPAMSVLTVCCFFAAKYAIEFSLSIAKLTMPKSRPVNLYTIFKTYCNKYLIFSGISVVCALIEIIFNLLFLKYFNF